MTSLDAWRLWSEASALVQPALERAVELVDRLGIVPPLGWDSIRSTSASAWAAVSSAAAAEPWLYVNQAGSPQLSAQALELDTVVLALVLLTAMHATLHHRLTCLPVLVVVGTLVEQAPALSAASATSFPAVASCPPPPAWQPSARLLKHIVRCYLRLSDNPRAREALRQCLPEPLRDATFSGCLKDDVTTKRWLTQLLFNISESAQMVQ